MKDVATVKARFAVILDDAAATGRASIKNMESGEQMEAALGELRDRLK
jgi:histidyl-tRNA synthetase